MRRRAILLFVVIAAALGVATSSTVALALEPTQNSTTTTSSPSSSSGVQPYSVIGGITSAWGYNGDGELGNNSTTASFVPTPVSGLSSSEVKSVSAGVQHSLALKNDGTVWAWGLNGNGQLGNDSTTHSLVPVQVKDPNDPSHTGFLHDVIAVSAGASHSLALKNDGTVWAWG